MMSARSRLAEVAGELLAHLARTYGSIARTRGGLSTDWSSLRIFGVPRRVRLAQLLLVRPPVVLIERTERRLRERHGVLAHRARRRRSG